MNGKVTGLVVALSLLLAGCGDDRFRASPYVGYVAPPPPNGFQPPPQLPNYPPPPNVFQPQLPPQMPPRFYPFVPVFQVMQQTPQLQQQWQVMWGQWQQYAQYRGCSSYDFQTFWFEFCPQQQTFAPQYQYLDQNFYFFVDYQTYFPPQADCGDYWGAWNYYPIAY